MYESDALGRGCPRGARLPAPLAAAGRARLAIDSPAGPEHSRLRWQIPPLRGIMEGSSVCRRRATPVRLFAELLSEAPAAPPHARPSRYTAAGVRYPSDWCGRPSL